ncbi:hypothetical protein RhiirA4_548027 [Rhizophagus irregularis]|uniref:Uncharacterized protein n=1 Tax=Rhizophagus irregularis TaxID=588596 RepID=A0A2I1H5E3_9GLOM|nr:hypothetical protein RhiirA4_548027 [Rhizophagus irregularis]
MKYITFRFSSFCRLLVLQHIGSMVRNFFLKKFFLIYFFFGGSALGLESGISSLALVLGHADMASDSFGENFDKPTICNSARKRKSATVKPKKSNKINNQSIPHR